MTKTDILVSKDQEIKRLNDEIRNLTEKIANLQISIGSKDEVLKARISEYEKELQLARDQQKILIRTGATGKKYKCERCGYETNNLSSYCPSCDKHLSLKLNTITGDTYKNLDTELAEIRKSVEKQMKKSVSDLEDKILDLEINIETLENEGKRKDKRHNREIDDLQTKNLDRINEYKEKIKDLEEEIVKVKKNKTDEELEAKRKEEVEKLKAANTKLIERIVEAEKLGFWTRFVNKLFGKMLRREALKEILEASELNKKIENTKQRNWKNGTDAYQSPYGWVVTAW